MSYNNNRLSVIDTETGEILDNAIAFTKEQIEAHKKHKVLQKKAEQQKHDKTENQFVWNLFSSHNNLSDLKPQTAIRLAYLATYLEYDSDFLKNHGNIITREKTQSLMALKSTTFKEFIKAVTEKKYLIKEKKCYRINNDVFTKGEMKLTSDLSEKRAMRIYVNTLRKLYLSTPQNKHVYPGYIFQLVPYVNREFNIICHNPLEQVRENINPMTISQVCDKIGYDKSHAARLIKEYSNIGFEWQGVSYPLIANIQSSEKKRGELYVNPLIIYGGNDCNRYEILKSCFAKGSEI